MLNKTKCILFYCIKCFIKYYLLDRNILKDIFIIFIQYIDYA